MYIHIYYIILFYKICDDIIKKYNIFFCFFKECHISILLLHIYIRWKNALGGKFCEVIKCWSILSNPQLSQISS